MVWVTREWHRAKAAPQISQRYTVALMVEMIAGNGSNSHRVYSLLQLAFGGVR